MKVLTAVRMQPPWAKPQTRLPIHRSQYEWERDYPIELQSKDKNGESEITLEFQLSEQEVEDFVKEIKSYLNGTLPLKIALGPQGTFSIRVSKKGPGASKLTAKSPQIARFVARRLDFEHIPAVRTASAAQRVVAEMVERELATLESDEIYSKAVEAIAALQQPVLDRLSTSVKQTLSQFLPDVTDVKVLLPPEERYRAFRRSCQIVVDDGTATLLEHKGDGVQSLAALGIMRHASETGAIGRNLVVAIEEPESHLHPGAIHELRQVLDDLSKRHQIVLTTHNPLFVDRTQLRRNILVKDRKAKPAQSVAELRDALGVRASDNLRHAEIVLLVEGLDDKMALAALLSHFSSKIRETMDSGTLAIEALEGATNLSYKASLVRQALCLVHSFLDADQAGKQGFERARIQGVISDGEVNWSLCDGMAESEVEDLYDPQLYEEMLQNIYRVSIQIPQFRTSNKWCTRMEATFRRQGKIWDDRVEAEVKSKIAGLVAGSPHTALLAAKRSSFDGLVRTLEARLRELAAGRR